MPTARQLQEMFMSAEFADAEAGAREWEPRDDEDEGDYPEVPLDVRLSLSSKYFDEAMHGYPAAANGAGLVDAFVHARRSSEPIVMRGLPRRQREAPRVIDDAHAARSRRTAPPHMPKKATVTS